MSQQSVARLKHAYQKVVRAYRGLSDLTVSPLDYWKACDALLRARANAPEARVPARVKVDGFLVTVDESDNIGIDALDGRDPPNAYELEGL